MRAVDKHQKAGKTATSDDSPFTLVGGTYCFVAKINAGSGLSTNMQILSADGTNYVDLFTAFAHVDGVQTLYLPPGKFHFAVTGTAGGGESFDLFVCQTSETNPIKMHIRTNEGESVSIS